MKRIGGLFLAAMFAVGCQARHFMAPHHQSLAPSLKEIQAQPVVFGVFYLNPTLDLAEGGEGRFAWKAVLVPLDEKDQEESYLAVDLGFQDWEACLKKLSIVLPYRNGQPPKGLLGVVNHDGTMIFNQRGESRRIKSTYRALKAKDYQGFLSEVDLGKPYFKAVYPDSNEYRVLEGRYLALAIKDQDLGAKLDYAFKTYGTNRTAEEWREIAMKDEIIYNLLDAMFSRLNGFVFIPFNPQGTAISFGVLKLIDLATIWDNRVRHLPGYSNFEPPMWYVGLTFDRATFYYVCRTANYLKQNEK